MAMLAVMVVYPHHLWLKPQKNYPINRLAGRWVVALGYRAGGGGGNIRPNGANSLPGTTLGSPFEGTCAPQWELDQTQTSRVKVRAPEPLNMPPPTRIG